MVPHLAQSKEVSRGGCRVRVRLGEDFMRTGDDEKCVEEEKRRQPRVELAIEGSLREGPVRSTADKRRGSVKRLRD